EGHGRNRKHGMRRAGGNGEVDHTLAARELNRRIVFGDLGVGLKTQRNLSGDLRRIWRGQCDAERNLLRGFGGRGHSRDGHLRRRRPGNNREGELLFSGSRGAVSNARGEQERSRAYGCAANDAGGGIQLHTAGQSPSGNEPGVRELASGRGERLRVSDAYESVDQHGPAGDRKTAGRAGDGDREWLAGLDTVLVADLSR